MSGADGERPCGIRRAVNGGVPELARFFGITIGMFYREHGRPHFHAAYGGHTISVEIDTLIVRGEIPPRAQALVLEWASRHRAELRENWDLVSLGQPLRRIAPLE